jgi:hypothetical protein
MENRPNMTAKKNFQMVPFATIEPKRRESARPLVHPLS